ncbi:MAG: hypothetical protein OXT74_18525 [Candidatus Poribacteria bacterium]|nr:hypothetical protein [Candidatus Poribacteria bacterium]
MTWSIIGYSPIEAEYVARERRRLCDSGCQSTASTAARRVILLLRESNKKRLLFGEDFTDGRRFFVGDQGSEQRPR